MPDRNGEDAAPHGPRVSGDDWCRPPGWRRPRSWSSPRSTPACLPTAAAAVVVALTVAALTLWCAALLRVLRADRAADRPARRGHRDPPHTGRWVELRAGVKGTCRTAVVTATGDFGEISPC